MREVDMNENKVQNEEGNYNTNTPVPYCPVFILLRVSQKAGVCPLNLLLAYRICICIYMCI
jgi:hypothetical protein